MKLDLPKTMSLWFESQVNKCTNRSSLISLTCRHAWPCALVLVACRDADRASQCECAFAL